MEQLKVIGTEDDALVLATESGERFSLAVDDVLRVELRKARSERDGDAPATVRARARSRRTSAPGCRPRRSPRSLGARVEDIARFEGPVLAEREHVVGQALAVPVLLGGDSTRDAHPTFGSAVRAKLAEAGATRRALDELEGADRLDRQARVHRRARSTTTRAGASSRDAARSRRSTPTRSSCRGRARCPTG